MLLPERIEVLGFNLLVTLELQLQLLVLVVSPTEKSILIILAIHPSEVRACVLFTDHSLNC